MQDQDYAPHPDLVPAPDSADLNVNKLPPRTRSAAVLARRARCWELRLAGHTNARIAKALGISEAAVSRHLKKTYEMSKDFISENVSAQRKIDLDRIESMLTRLWPRRDDPRVVDSIGRLMERRSRLLGLDAPARHEHSGRGGGPIVTAGVVFDATRLTTEQLRQLEGLLSQASVEVAADAALVAPEAGRGVPDASAVEANVVPLVRASHD